MAERKRFYAYVIPSLLAFALSGVYAIVDGFFVGNAIGDSGLSAINIAYPVVSLIQAVGTGIGMGGAVHFSIAKAAGDEEKADTYVSSIFIFLFIASFVLTAILSLSINPVLHLLGAEGNIFTLGKEYLKIMIFCAVFQVMAVGVVPVIRNCQGASFAMGSMIAGFVTNIVLDYLFVWVLEGGLKGAAYATIIGQVVTMIAGFAFLIIHKIPLFKWKGSFLLHVFANMVKVGIAPFGLTISPILSLMFINRASITYGGESAVACYACIAYATTIVYLLLQGVGDGSQPLLSESYGRGAQKELRQMETLAYQTALILAVICMAVLFVTRNELGSFFGTSDKVEGIVAEVLPVFLIGFPFLAFTRVTTSVFYATEKTIFSYILVFAEPIALLVLLLFLPTFMGQQGVWRSVLTAQILAAILAGVFTRRADKREG